MANLVECLGRSQPFVQVMPKPIIAQRAPATTDTKYPKGQPWIDESVSPTAIYTHLGGGDWDSGGNSAATTTTPGIVELSTLVELQGGTAPTGAVPTSNDVATVIAGVVVGAVPPATEGTQGIGELATDVEAVAGTPSTGALALLVTPSNLTPVFAAPPAIGGTTPAAGTFTDLTADGILDLDTTVAGHIKVTGAADFTVESTLGSVILNAEEAADDAIQLTSVAGGLSASVGLSAVIASTEANADSVQLTSAGGMDITATGAAGKDLDIVSTSGSVNITAGENIANSMVITNKGMDIAIAGAAGQDFDLVNTGGSVNITATENVANAIVLNASAGGIDITNTGTAGEDIDIASTGASVNVSSTENAALAVYLHANGGTSETIRLRADQGTGANSIEMISDVGGILAQSGLDNANAIYLHANAGTSETIKIHSDQGTGVASVEVASDVGGVTISSGLASDDAINLSASAGGVDIDGALQVNIASSQNAVNAIRINASAGGIDIDAVGAATEDINITNTGGSIVIAATEAVTDALVLNAVTALGGIDVNAGTGGMTIDSGGVLSLDSAGATNLTATGAFDVTVNSTAGSVIIKGEEAVSDAIQLTSAVGGLAVSVALDAVITSTEDAADSIYLHANGGTSETIRLHSDLGTGVGSVTLESDVGGITALSGLASADAINLTATSGGVDIDGALQVNIASSQADAGAITLSASNASGGITHTGKCIYTPDSITSDNAGVAASVSTVLTQITTDGDSNEDNVTLADGVAGQLKIFSVIAAGNAADSIKITPANFSQGTKITFAADPTGKGCQMIFDGTNWNVVSNNGGTIA